MRLALGLGLAVIILLAEPITTAHAQVPGPKITFSGFTDSVTTAASNVFDADYTRDKDSGWTARTRGRYRLTADVEPLQLLAVLELEVDFLWGDTGNPSDTARGFSLNGGFTPTMNGTDIFEAKSFYVELPLPRPRGVPWIPYTTARIGGQPFRTTLKQSVLATGDYAGVSLESEICGAWTFSLPCDDARVSFTYAQLEKSLAGPRPRPAVADRGDDFFTFLGVTYPIPIDRRALRVVPRVFWAYLDAEGTTALPARCRIACAGLPLNGRDPPGTQAPPGTPEATTGNFRPGSNESRHYVGIDGAVEIELGRSGKIHIDPTVIYMASTVDVYGRPGVPAAALCGPAGDIRCPAGPRQISRARSWLVDLRAGWYCNGSCLDETWVGDVVRFGTGIHLEGLFMWTPGDASQHNLFRKNRVYHPIDTDSDYLNSWSEILSTGSVDYLTGNSAHGMGENVGLGQYGRVQVGARLTWDAYQYWDRGLSVHLKWSSAWTDQKVDTDAGSPQPDDRSGSFGNVPCALLEANCLPGNNRRGDASYIGTETSVGITYQFTRNIVFDVVGAYLFAGPALDSTVRQADGALVKRPAKDAQLAAARLRFSF